jgi:hypothetical protein
MLIGREKLPARGLSTGPFVAFRKIDDPILLALSAVVSKGADTGAAASPDRPLLSPVQILVFPNHFSKLRRST